MGKIYYDKISLNSGMSLILGDKPEKMDLTLISIPKNKLEVASLGLFESSTPNFVTYYPEIKNAADIKPNESDFIKPIFRLLSEVIVRKNTNPVDFSKNGVLKNSMNKLKGQTVFANHDSMVGNEIGSVSNVAWQEAYVTDSGINVPAGINGEFKIDAKSHPMMARKILMEPPAIHSNSVTIEFGWEISHPSMDMDEFRSKIGTYASDGQLVRRIANDIKNYHETSLVAHGADPYAQLVGKDGKINNADYADNVYSLSAQGKEKPTIYFFNYRDDIISLTEDNSTPPNHNNNQPENMKELQIQLAKLLAKTEAEITEAFMLQYLKDNPLSLTNAATLQTAQADLATANTALTTEKASTADLTTKLATANGSITTLTADVAKFKPIAEAATTELKTETKRIYETLKGDKKDPAMIELIDKADNSQLTTYKKQYSDELEEKFPAKCNSCGSANVSRNTAKQEDPASGGDKPHKEISDAELAAQYRAEAAGQFILDKDKKD